MLFLFGEVTRGAGCWGQGIEVSSAVPHSFPCFCSFLNACFLLSGASPPLVYSSSVRMGSSTMKNLLCSHATDPFLSVFHHSFLNMLIQMHLPLGWGVQLCPAGWAGTIWNCMCLAWSNSCLLTKAVQQLPPPAPCSLYAVKRDVSPLKQLIISLYRGIWSKSPFRW